MLSMTALFLYRGIVQQFFVAHVQYARKHLQLNIRYKALTIFNPLHSILIYIQPFNLQHIRKLPLRYIARQPLAQRFNAQTADVVAAIIRFVFIHSPSRNDIHWLSFPLSYDRLKGILTSTKCHQEKQTTQVMAMQVSYKAIGRNMRAAREAAGLTQENMADLMGISLLHYGRLERGERRISLDLVANAAQILHVSIPSLLSGMTHDAIFPATFSNPDGIGKIIDFLSAGCSDHATGLMLDICTLIAQQDKYFP